MLGDIGAIVWASDLDILSYNCISRPATMFIIPRPLAVRCLALEGFQLMPETLITYSDEDVHILAVQLQAFLCQATGMLLSLARHVMPDEPSVHLRLSEEVEELRHLPNNDEGYVLSIGSKQGAVIVGHTLAGLRYGTQSLLQLLLPPVALAPTPQLHLPAVHIVDAPRFRWRGVMVDTGRHFFSVDFLRRLLDLMLFYKLNTLHWHLCEDQGWRLEVRQFPRLTEFGAWRAVDGGAKGEGGGERYGGFYTQAEVRELVEYAGARGITIVPEIEMPGHCVAALASYSHLSCTGQVKEVSNHWGVHEDVYCAGREEVFSFLEGVLSEVLELFPSKYIHVGGDEVPKVRWSECERCQQRISDEGLEDEEELQAWFLARINAFLRSRGRQLVGWDEILEGGLCEGAVVMSWRGIVGGVAAARAGHDVVMTPSHSCYFDYRQGPGPKEPGAWYAQLTLRQVYEFDPVPPEPGSVQRTGPQPQPRAPSTEPMLLDSGEGEGASEGEDSGLSDADMEPESPPAPAQQQQQQEEEEEEEKEEQGREEQLQEGEGDTVLCPAVPPPPRPPQQGQQGPPPAAAAALAAATTAAAAAAAAAAALEASSAAHKSFGLTLTPEEAKHILGGQANLWTEYVSTEAVAEYMLVPRVCAMAEALWSPLGSRDWDGFRERLRAHEGVWPRMGINYRPLEE